MKSSLISLLIIALAVVSCESTKQDPLSQEVIEMNIDQGTNMAAAVSPDGQTIAFDVLGRIWIMPVDGGEAIAITDSLGNARQPAWSPDGKHITFQAYWEGNWHIYVINKDGSNLKRMSDGLFDHREPFWSPDGSTLVFSSDRNGNYDIWTRDILREKSTAITSSGANEYAPAWSPDGKSLAYVNDDRSAGGIIIRSLENGSEQRVYSSTGALTGVTWSPDGNDLIFNELNESSAQINKINLESKEVTPVTSPEEEAFPFRVSWQSDSTLTYTASGQIKNLTVGQESTNVPFSAKLFLERNSYPRKTRDFDSTNPQNIKGIFGPAISPDGQQVVFTALQDLWLRNADGSLQQLTSDPYVDILACWSRDGKNIAFSSDRDGSFAIWSMNIETGDTRKVLETGGSASGLSWSPDGSSIAYTQSFGPRGGQLWIVNVNSGQRKRVGRPVPSSVGVPTWSSDGNIVALSVLNAYSSLYREGVNRVILFSTNGLPHRPQKAVEHWSFGVRGNNGPVWSPDGKYMAAATKGSIWIVPVDEKGDATGEPIQVTEELSDAPTWTGDSKEILYIATDRLKIVNLETRESRDVPIDLQWTRKIPSGKKIIHAGTLINPDSERVETDVDIIIEGHRITGVEPHDDNREADIVIDASDNYVIPGLIDLHAHEGSDFGERLGRAWLSWGVTTIRNPSADPYDEINRREAFQMGKASGPRMYITGSPIDGSRIYYGGAIALQSEEQIDKELDRAKRLEYDLIKTYVRLSDPLQQRVVEGAHAIGIPVTSHELYPAVSYNTDGTEHVSGTSRIGYSSKISRTWQAYGDVTDMLAKSGMSFTPTTAIIAYKYLIDRDSSLREDIRSKTFAGMTGEGIPGLIDPSMMKDESNEELYENLIRMVTDVHQKGGFIVAGTDSPIIPYGMSLHLELETYQNAGLTPKEILKTATVNNAIALNAQNDLGSVREGMLADLVILKENPLDDIKNTRSTEIVIKNGEVYGLQELLRRPE